MITIAPIVWGFSLIFVAGVLIVVGSMARDHYLRDQEEQS